MSFLYLFFIFNLAITTVCCDGVISDLSQNAHNIQMTLIAKGEKIRSIKVDRFSCYVEIKNTTTF